MDTAKIYQNSKGDNRNIWQMVREEPDWAANRVQAGESAINSLQQLKAKIYEFRDSLEWYRDNVDREYANGFLNKLNEIQKLSAI